MVWFLFCPDHIVTACPAGMKYCEATQSCEDNSVDDVLCCGSTKSFCGKTKRCEWIPTFDTICSKFRFLSSEFLSLSKSGCPFGEKFCNLSAACVNIHLPDADCCESTDKHCRKTDQCMDSSTSDNDCGEEDSIL